VGLRRHGLTRFRRGGEADLLALPALFVDVDDPDFDALERLRAMQPAPSCITFTGGGFHAYWWMDQPLVDWTLARRVLRGLQRAAGGDPLSVANALRLPGSVNTKPQRNQALCRVVELNDRYYPLAAFEHLLPRPTVNAKTVSPRRQARHHPANGALNPALLGVVSDHLRSLGYVQQGDWLSGPCLYPAQHQHDDAHHSFGLNVRSGYGNCFRCGSLLLKDICTSLGIRPADYGGIFV
jgi:hypothetical protein